MKNRTAFGKIAGKSIRCFALVSLLVNFLDPWTVRIKLLDGAFKRKSIIDSYGNFQYVVIQSDKIVDLDKIH